MANKNGLFHKFGDWITDGIKKEREFKRNREREYWNEYDDIYHQRERYYPKPRIHETKLPKKR
jgi:hypothetical protein